MAFTYEVDPDVEANGAVQEDYGSDYEGFFEEEDFEALGINPTQPTAAKPGSEDKVLVLAARYAAGLPLWHNADCYDHGPRGSILDDEDGETEEEDELED